MSEHVSCWSVSNKIFLNYHDDYHFESQGHFSEEIENTRQHEMTEKEIQPGCVNTTQNQLTTHILGRLKLCLGTSSFLFHGDS